MPPSTSAAGEAQAGTVSKEIALRLFHFMKLTRETEDRLERKLYRQGKIVGGCYVGRGQEAITTGCTGALEKDDVITSALGEHISSHFLAAKRQEWREYITQVSSWELESYLAKY